MLVPIAWIVGARDWDPNPPTPHIHTNIQKKFPEQKGSCILTMPFSKGMLSNLDGVLAILFSCGRPFDPVYYKGPTETPAYKSVS